MVYLRDAQLLHMGDEMNGPCPIGRDADQYKLTDIQSAALSLIDSGVVTHLTDGHTFAVRHARDAAKRLADLLEQSLVLQGEAARLADGQSSVDAGPFVRGITDCYRDLGVQGTNSNAVFLGMIAATQLQRLGYTRPDAGTTWHASPLTPRTSPSRTAARAVSVSQPPCPGSCADTRNPHPPHHQHRIGPTKRTEPRHTRRKQLTMGYFIGVLLQTVILPIVSGTLELVTAGGNPVEIYGRWWVFWGVGTRLVVAGIVQLVRPQTTAEILGTEQPAGSELQVVRELSTANLGMGLAGLLALVPAWAAPAGLAGGVFLLIAGLMHVTKKNKNPAEHLATWTDLLVGVIAVVFLGYALVSQLV
ncbi:hypothetical protein GCM10022236_47010 [Microlunatus ginsengisoli]|uniref:Uncharacterized protein n=1 Tax=Microlunatus ginsengisoli TaxID=363863 RepID=A0ABP7ASK0_9ACTN